MFLLKYATVISNSELFRKIALSILGKQFPYFSKFPHVCFMANGHCLKKKDKLLMITYKSGSNFIIRGKK